MNLSGARRGRTLMGGLAIVMTAVLLTLLARRHPTPPKPGEVPAYRQQGPRTARVTIVVYSDFECPYCRLGAQALGGLAHQYPDKLHIVFRHKPLMNVHPYARMAAQAAECAGVQGKFWEFHDALFSHQDDWTRPADAFPQMINLAKQTGLDIPELNDCFKNPATSALIEADLNNANANQINATPTFLVDDQRCVGSNQLLTMGVAEIKKRLGS